MRHVIMGATVIAIVMQAIVIVIVIVITICSKYYEYES